MRPVFAARPDLGATTDDMSALWWAYCNDLVVDAVKECRQRWMLGYGGDGA